LTERTRDAQKVLKARIIVLGQEFSLFGFCQVLQNKCAKLGIAKTGLENLKKRGGK
jgi:hypothetical protein